MSERGEKHMQDLIKQAEMAIMMERLARMMADYRTSLLGAGIPKELADRLVVSLSDRLFEASFNQNIKELQQPEQKPENHGQTN